MVLGLYRTENGKSVALARPEEDIDPTILLVGVPDLLWLESHSVNAFADQLLELAWGELMNEFRILFKVAGELFPDAYQLNACEFDPWGFDTF